MKQVIETFVVATILISMVRALFEKKYSRNENAEINVCVDYLLSFNFFVV